jgi:hypothetical protein
MIAGRRYQYAACAHDGLRDEGSDFVWSELLNAPLELFDQEIAVLLLGPTFDAAIHIRSRDVVDEAVADRIESNFRGVDSG